MIPPAQRCPERYPIILQYLHVHNTQKSNDQRNHGIRRPGMVATASSDHGNPPSPSATKPHTTSPPRMHQRVRSPRPPPSPFGGYSTRPAIRPPPRRPLPSRWPPSRRSQPPRRRPPPRRPMQQKVQPQSIELPRKNLSPFGCEADSLLLRGSDSAGVEGCF